MPAWHILGWPVLNPVIMVTESSEVHKSYQASCFRVVRNMTQPVNSMNRDSLLHFDVPGSLASLYTGVESNPGDSVLYEVEKDILIAWHH